MFVILRLALGCHFLYEGVWKIENRKEFSAKPYLAEAKGPAAKFFYNMLPDLDGRGRLAYQKVKSADGKEDVSFSGEFYVGRWDAVQKQLAERYKIGEDQSKQAQTVYRQHKAWLDDYLKENHDEMLGYFRALDKLEADVAAGNNGTPFQQKRLWDRQQELRKQAEGWVKYLDDLDSRYTAASWELLESDQRAKGAWGESWWNPLTWTRMEQLNAMVTYSLTAIGLCLMLGFCTRLAALGGAAFMAFIVLSQPAWPTIYPPAPAVAGHALLVNKDLLEMLCLLLLATVPAGRWGGLDYFLYRLLGRRIGGYFSARV